MRKKTLKNSNNLIFYSYRMKKTILTIVTFISLLLTTALVSASYNFTAKDKQLINALTQKVEQVISEKGEKFRTPLVE